MLHSSIPVGKFLGVDIRVHISFPFLLFLAIAWSVVSNHHALRGVGLWTALCFAVIVRETARSIAAAYSGLRLRALFLLPVGGIMAFAPRDPNPPAGSPASIPPAQWDTRAVSAAGPIANFLIGLILLGASYAFDPHVSLLAPPWIGTTHILRTFIWTQFILGTVSLLPASLLASRNLPRPRSRASDSTEPAATSRPEPAPASIALTPRGLPVINFGTVLAFGLIIAGMAFPAHLYLIICGFFLLLGSQLGAAQPANNAIAESILVHEVMLTEYTLLNSSDTLQGALDRTVHSLQDVFPVVRGDRLVGSIARQTIADRLQTEGDGYLQGVMTRTLQLASPSEKLVEALRRAATLGASEFIPVVEDARLLGILTPQSLSRNVQQVALSRPPQPEPRNRDSQ
ncbi:MAG: CBS domain-containing protein [Acidobacteriota bacterium]